MGGKDSPPACPLCGDCGARLFCERDDPSWKRRAFYDCPACRLVFVPEAFHLPAQDEKAHYGQHQNSPDDPQYLAYLEERVAPVRERIPVGAKGLDFGCGPRPGMGRLLPKASVTDYDAIYFPDEALLGEKYDFVTCCETAEHFRAPGAEWGRLFRLLKPGGLLGVRTEILEPGTEFGSWWYQWDPTHVAFYRRESFDWIARRWGAAREFVAGNIILLKKR